MKKASGKSEIKPQTSKLQVQKEDSAETKAKPESVVVKPKKSKGINAFKNAVNKVNTINKFSMLSKINRPGTTKSERASYMVVAKGGLVERESKEEVKASKYYKSAIPPTKIGAKPTTATQKLRKTAKVIGGAVAWKKATTAATARKTSGKTELTKKKEEPKPSTARTQPKQNLKPESKKPLKSSEMETEESLSDERLEVYEKILKLGYPLPQVRRSETHCGLSKEKMLKCLETHDIPQTP